MGARTKLLPCENVCIEISIGKSLNDLKTYSFDIVDFSRRDLYLTISSKAWNWFTAFLWPQPWCPPGERQYFRFILVQHKMSGQTAKGSLIIDTAGGQDWANY